MVSAAVAEKQPQNFSIEAEIGMFEASMLSYIMLISFQQFEEVKIILIHELCRTSQRTSIGCNL